MRRSARNSRRSSVGLSSQDFAETSPAALEKEANFPVASRKTRTKKRTAAQKDASDIDAGEYVEPDAAAAPRGKRRKIAGSGKNGSLNAQLHDRLFGRLAATSPSSATCPLPSRAHGVDYHRPLLLDSRQGRAALLDWFDTVSTSRAMPWRKAWIDPRATADDAPELLRRRLEHRAYEVWISEIMLQQTRVAVVIDYWNRWMARWPTIHDLAAAEPDDVLAAWRGLGYYSRATRIHEAAKLVCRDGEMQGLLPSDVEALAANVPGVGRYTAGAISAIVFGRAAPMVDGNVLRVLSRQLGVLGDVKSDKAVVDLLWAAADSLVKAVARDSDDDTEETSDVLTSDRPGRWGQALMELGSTICMPKPNCASCPITSSCRAYGEGLQVAARKGLAPKPTTNTGTTDIEDACTLCKPFEELEENESDARLEIKDNTNDELGRKPQRRKQATLQSFAFTQSTRSRKTTNSPSPALSVAATEVISNHAKKFPVKTIKKAVREEETLVCAIRRSDGKYLIHRRPQKGLLAGLWEFPSHILPDAQSATSKTRKRDAGKYVSDILATKHGVLKPTRLKHVGELGSVPWLFSHLKLTMHVHLFDLKGSEDGEAGVADGASAQCRWSDAVDEESMGTGMRKCWALVKEANVG
ncbi:DNA glycosylase [Xylariaceae sp. FL0662B]|nr:DNA glycosylase [Xylariaceae sp. FL0662B]